MARVILRSGEKILFAYNKKDAFCFLPGGHVDETNIVTGGTEQMSLFSIIDSAKIVRETRGGRMQEIEIELSEWVFNAISAIEVLTLHRNYFRLRKPLERQIYEIGRKYCARKSSWRVSLSVLKQKCGSTSISREFKRLVSKIAEQDETFAHMPDYIVCLDGDYVNFTNRGTMHQEQSLTTGHKIYLASDTHDKARKVAPGWDVHYLESRWREWMIGKKQELPKHLDAAFIGFCKRWFENNGTAN